MPFQPRIAFPVPDQNTIIFFLDLCIHFFISFDCILSENIWHGKEILYTVFPFKFYILLQIDVPDFADYRCIKLSFVLYTCRYTAFFFACCFCYPIRISIESRCCFFHSTTGFFPSILHLYLLRQFFNTFSSQFIQCLHREEYISFNQNLQIIKCKLCITGFAHLLFDSCRI